MQLAATITRQTPGQLLIQWQVETVTSPVEIFWSTKPDSDSAGWQYLLSQAGESQVTIDDPNPQSRSYFKVVSHKKTIIVAERRLPLEGSPNFRDIGGYLSGDGRAVRWGQVYRSGDLSRLTDADLAYLERLGLKVICDFRTRFEADQSPNRQLDGSIIKELPIATGELPVDQLFQAVSKGDFSSLDTEHLVRANQLYLRDYTPVYKEMLDRISDDASRPALVLCTAGKDRTGLGVAILLWVLGVPTSTIFADYLLTNDYNAQRNERMLGMLRQHIANTNGVAADSIDMAPMVALISARRPYLQGAMDAIMVDFGSIEGYIREGLGMSPNEQAQLQDKLLVEPSLIADPG